MELKRCCRCLSEKPATPEFFHRCKGNADGLTHQCKGCRALMWKAAYEKNPAHYIAKAVKSSKERRKRPEVRDAERIWAKLAKRKKLSEPGERERHRAQVREWFRANTEKVRNLPSRSKALRAFYTSMRNAQQLRATPAWADKARIAEFYREAQRLTAETGVPHEVDHIVPLRHKHASGLHVHHNLRVVTQFVNRSKSNLHISI